MHFACQPQSVSVLSPHMLNTPVLLRISFQINSPVSKLAFSLSSEFPTLQMALMSGMEQAKACNVKFLNAPLTPPGEVRLHGEASYVWVFHNTDGGYKYNHMATSEVLHDGRLVVAWQRGRVSEGMNDQELVSLGLFPLRRRLPHALSWHLPSVATPLPFSLQYHTRTATRGCCLHGASCVPPGGVGGANRYVYLPCAGNHQSTTQDIGNM